MLETVKLTASNTDGTQYLHPDDPAQVRLGFAGTRLGRSVARRVRPRRHDLPRAPSASSTSAGVSTCKRRISGRPRNRPRCERAPRNVRERDVRPHKFDPYNERDFGPTGSHSQPSSPTITCVDISGAAVSGKCSGTSGPTSSRWWSRHNLPRSHRSSPSLLWPRTVAPGAQPTWNLQSTSIVQIQ